MALDELVERRLTRLPRPVDPASDLHAQPEAGGRVAGRNGRRTTRLSRGQGSRSAVPGEVRIVDSRIPRRPIRTGGGARQGEPRGHDAPAPPAARREPRGGAGVRSGPRRGRPEGLTPQPPEVLDERGGALVTVPRAPWRAADRGGPRAREAGTGRASEVAAAPGSGSGRRRPRASDPGTRAGPSPSRRAPRRARRGRWSRPRGGPGPAPETCRRLCRAPPPAG